MKKSLDFVARKSERNKPRSKEKVGASDHEFCQNKGKRKNEKLPVATLAVYSNVLRQ